MTGRPRVVVTTPMRNEAWILDLFLRTASLWADDIVLSDQMSDDRSAEIAARFEKVHLVRHETLTFHEGGHRAALLAAARRLVPGPRVFVVLDADEILGATVLNSPLWEAAIRSRPGTAINLRWVNLRPGFASAWDGGVRPFAFVDDGADYAGAVFHAHRIPVTGIAPAIEIADVPVLHYQYVDWPRMRSKHRWYQCFDRLQHPDRSAVDLFRQYHHMFGASARATTPIDAAWFAEYQRCGIDPQSVVFEHRFRWDAEVLDLFDAHGARRFAREWVWDQDWVAVARREGRPNPERYADPRGFGQRCMHRWLVATQQLDDRRAMRLLDRLFDRPWRVMRRPRRDRHTT